MCGVYDRVDKAAFLDLLTKSERFIPDDFFGDHSISLLIIISSSLLTVSFPCSNIH